MEPFDSALPAIGLGIAIVAMLAKGAWDAVRALKEAWALRRSGPYGPSKRRER